MKEEKAMIKHSDGIFPDGRMVLTVHRAQSIVLALEAT